MKFVVFVLFFSFLGLTELSAQSKYNFDYNKRANKSGFLSIFNKSAQKKIDPCPKPSKKAERDSDKVRRKHYNKQTAEVKKRMKKSRKKADRFNTGKTPFWIKLKAKFNGSVF